MVKSDIWLERIEKELQIARDDGKVPDVLIELIDELHVHQTELEMQNEELNRSQQEITELYNKYHELYNGLPVGYFTLNENGIIKNVNVKGARLLSFRGENGREWLINTAFCRFIPQNQQQKFYKAFKASVKERKTQEVEIQLKRDNVLFYALMKIKPPHHKNNRNYYIIIEDITKRINAEGVLKRTMDELKRSNEELEQFAYVSSHDLQEPLRMVSSFTQLLERRYKGQLDSEADEYIAFVVDGAKRMKELIDDLLEFSRLNTQAGEFKMVSLQIALRDVLSNLQTFIKDNNATITYEPLPTIMGDPSQLNQLFQNLISNAIKFHDDEPPEIHISAQKDEDEWVFGVSDNGIGIDPGHQEQIFDVFKRLHTREEYAGTGIGLAICKKIVERHRGRIWVESELGKGSSFYFTIPK